jgi:hypothetical protein
MQGRCPLSSLVFLEQASSSNLALGPKQKPFWPAVRFFVAGDTCLTKWLGGCPVSFLIFIFSGSFNLMLYYSSMSNSILSLGSTCSRSDAVQIPTQHGIQLGSRYTGISYQPSSVHDHIYRVLWCMPYEIGSCLNSLPELNDKVP